jgi:pimeloyl-ACP methyl ester carboxylesterase
MGKSEHGLFYKVIGNKSSCENLVFVHGSGCNHKFLIPLAQKLKDYRCYLIDLPCHGKSDDIYAESVDNYIDAVAGFVSGLSNVTLIGHSLGGTICLGVAARAIPSVKRSVVISSGAKFDMFDERIHEMVRTQKVNWVYLFSCLGSLHKWIVLKSLLTFDPPEIMLKDFKIDIELDVEPVLKDIQTPTLVMVGTSDPLTPPEYSYRIRKQVGKSKLLLIPHYKHMLPIANREVVSFLIQRFIRKNICK